MEMPACTGQFKNQEGAGSRGEQEEEEETRAARNEPRERRGPLRHASEPGAAAAGRPGAARPQQPVRHSPCGLRAQHVAAAAAPAPASCRSPRQGGTAHARAAGQRGGQSRPRAGLRAARGTRGHRTGGPGRTGGIPPLSCRSPHTGDRARVRRSCRAQGQSG